MSLTCNFCNKIFANVSSLNYHKDTAKYCLKIQGKEETEKTSKCHICNRSFTSKNNLNIHLESCESYFRTIIEPKNKQIINLTQEAEKYKLLYQDTLKLHKNTMDILERTLQKSNTTVINITDYESEEIPLNINEKLNSVISDEDDNKIEVSTYTLNDISVIFRHKDDYINASKLCESGNKKFIDWIYLESTKELIDILSDDTTIDISVLIQTDKKTIWIYPDLAIQLSNWISPLFSLCVSKCIRKQLEIRKKDLVIKNKRIKYLESICLSKQKRIEYPEKNVIYLLTTDDHMKRRTYIIGKAKNLMCRLATYNKTCDHKVVYYKECKTEEDMALVETLVLSKLKDYKEQANRDRFILPEQSNIQLFISVINECIDFVNNS